MLNVVYTIWYSMTNECSNLYAEMTVSFYITVQVVGTDVDDVLQHLTDIQSYCQTTCGQHIHDILDRINVALAVSCMSYIFEFILSMFSGDLAVTLTVASCKLAYYFYRCYYPRSDQISGLLMCMLLRFISWTVERWCPL